MVFERFANQIRKKKRRGELTKLLDRASKNPVPQEVSDIVYNPDAYEAFAVKVDSEDDFEMLLNILKKKAHLPEEWTRQVFNHEMEHVAKAKDTYGEGNVGIEYCVAYDKGPDGDTGIQVFTKFTPRSGYIDNVRAKKVLNAPENPAKSDYEISKALG